MTDIVKFYPKNMIPFFFRFLRLKYGSLLKETNKVNVIIGQYHTKMATVRMQF